MRLPTSFLEFLTLVERDAHETVHEFAVLRSSVNL